MHPHLAPAFRRLKKSLFTLSAAIEENLHLAMEAVLKGDVAQAGRVRSRDLEIDLMEVDFEEECLQILALYQPVAIDLRFVAAVLKINNDLERIGDLAVNIAEHAKVYAGTDPGEAVQRLPKMAEIAQSMVRRSLDAVVDMDADLARDVLATDDEVDRRHRDNVAYVRQLLQETKADVERLLPVIFISKHLERIADHATNIAEDAIYMVDGEIVRHGRHHVARE
ncbi:MAG: phosphate signaling complex protein PhoU [Candidatus Krumholzibacteria bacterium]|jgi:phosphate transport system protein|nr:phosphate signaling complex protein PhoU [Candidatus Krumholzibacteria bacterium]